MVSIEEFPLLALGLVISAGIGFLLWTLYHLAWKSHTGSGTRRSR